MTRMRLAGMVAALLAAASCTHTLTGMKMNPDEREGCRRLLADPDGSLQLAYSPGHPGYVWEVYQVIVSSRKEGLSTRTVGPQQLQTNVGAIDMTPQASGQATAACTAFDRLPPNSRLQARQLGYDSGSFVPLEVMWTSPFRLAGLDVRMRAVGFSLPGSEVATGVDATGGGAPAAMKMKFADLRPEERKAALALGYREGDEISVEFDPATKQVRILPRPGTAAPGPGYALARVTGAVDSAITDLADRLPPSLRPADPAAVRAVELSVVLTAQADGFVDVRPDHFRLTSQAEGGPADGACVGVRIGGGEWQLDGGAGASVNLRLAGEVGLLCLAPTSGKPSALVFQPTGVPPATAPVP